MSTVFHPQTDGQSECTNQSLEQYLRFYVNDRQDNWACYLPMTEFMHNSWHNESTHTTPFKLLMGYHPRAEWTSMTSPIPQVTLQLDQMKESHEKAKEVLRKAQQGWEKWGSGHISFQEGDQVWSDGHNIKTHYPTTKLAPK